MTDINDEQDNNEIIVDELTVLKQRADLVGLTYHRNIGLESLKHKLAVFLNKDADKAPETPVQAPQAGKTTKIAPATKAQIQAFERKQAMKLRRVEIMNMNPNKRGWSGEILGASNSIVGTIKKFIPFNTPTHIPQILYNMMKDRQYQSFYTATDTKGNKIKRAKLVPEFAIKDLPPLTRKELQDLANQQARSGSTAA